MKKILSFVLILLLFCFFSFAETSSSSINWLSIGNGDQRYCKQGGNCELSNLTVSGGFVNITVQNVTINATSIFINGTAIGDVFVPYQDAGFDVDLNNQDLTNADIITANLHVASLAVWADNYYDQNGATQWVQTDGFGNALMFGNIDMDSFDIENTNNINDFATNIVSVGVDSRILVDPLGINTLDWSTSGSANFGSSVIRTLGSLVVDTMTIGSQTIADSSNTISFTNNNLETLGNITAKNLETIGNVTTNNLKLYDPDDDATMIFIHDRIFGATKNTIVTWSDVGVGGETHNFILSNWEDRNLGIDQDLRHNTADTVTFSILDVTTTFTTTKIKLADGWGIERSWVLDVGAIDGSTGFGLPGGDGSSNIFEGGLGGDSFGNQAGDGGDFRIKLGDKGIGQAGGTDGVDGIFVVGSDSQNLTIISGTGVNITTDLDVAGNITGSILYGEVWFNNNSVSGTPTTINVAGQWENVSGFNQQGPEIGGSTTNGFTVSNNNSLNTLKDGTYKLSYSISFERASGGAGREFEFAISINNEIQNKSEVHRNTGNVNDVGSISHSGFHKLIIGDMIHLMVRNTQGTEGIGTHNANLNLFWIGK